MSINAVPYLYGAEETLPIEQLHPFANHPFHVRHDLEMKELMDSIEESGIIHPILVRPKEGGEYEVISGHRRWEACKELGIKQVPAKVLYLDDDEATVLMVNSNIQREHVLPSEKAFAYKMRMDALSHQGKASLSQVGTKMRTLDAMGKEVNESRNQIHRYIRLTNLISPILQMVDENRIAFNPAVEISYMTEEHQRWLKEEMDLCDATPSLVQSRTLKEMSRNGTLTEDYLNTLLTEEKPNKRQKSFLNQSDVQQYFPPGYTPQQMHNTIMMLLRGCGNISEPAANARSARTSWSDKLAKRSYALPALFYSCIGSPIDIAPNGGSVRLATLDVAPRPATVLAFSNVFSAS